MADLAYVLLLLGWTAVPIIVLSARIESSDKVHALDAGADDYVTKPFRMAELLARLRAAVRHAVTPGGEAEPVVDAGELHVDLAAKRVAGRRGGAPHPDRVGHPRGTGAPPRQARRAAGAAAQRVGPAYGTQTNYLRVYLAQLRRMLEAEPSRPKHLITEPGMGYRFEL